MNEVNGAKLKESNVRLGQSIEGGLDSVADAAVRIRATSEQLREAVLALRERNLPLDVPNLHCLILKYLPAAVHLLQRQILRSRYESGHCHHSRRQQT